MNIKSMMLVAGCVAVVAEARAGITGVSGFMEQVSAPADARPNAFTHMTNIRVWGERSGVMLEDDLTVNAIAPGLYNEWSMLGDYAVPAGTWVDSYYVHYDTPDDVVGESIGTVFFDQDILGVIVLGDADEDPMQSLDPSDFLGSGTIYPDMQYRRGLEMFNDRFIIGEDQRSFLLKSYVITPGDSVRIVTRSTVPAPAGVAAFGVAGACLLRRRRS